MISVIDNQAQASGMRSNLVLMITHPEPELVFFSYTESETGAAELVVKKQLPLLDRAPRLSEFFNDVFVHPSGKLAGVHCYTGKLKIITLKAGSYQQDFDVSYGFFSKTSCHNFLIFLYGPDY
jgi:DNA damage-binding protein 1